jgi:hypothetical protein
MSYYVHNTTAFPNSVLSTNGATGSTLSWTSPTYTVATQGASNGALQVNGDANFDGDVKIQGKSIVDSLERIEERLAILRPNEELEQKWEKLRGLRKAYMELEAEIKEKEQIWAILKR